MRSMVEKLPAAAIYVGRETLFLNRAAEELLGYDRAEITTLAHWFARLLGASAEEFRRFHDHGRRADIPRPRTFSVIHKDGEPRLLEIVVYRDESGEMWLLHDVSDRLKAEDDLRQAETRTQAILDSAVDGIITMDEAGKVQSINPSAEVMFGYAAEEVVGRNVKMLMPSPFREEHDDYLRQYLETGRRQIIGIGREVIGRRKGGATFPLDLAVSEFFHGEKRAFVGTLRDITERKRLEDQFQQAQKMEAIGRLAGGVAHDFNTLLGTITGYAEMMLERLAPDHSLRRAAEQIHRGADRGAALTRQLLAFSRHQVRRPEALDLNTVLDGMDDMLRRLIGEHIDLVCSRGHELGRVWADAGQVEQVIMNLIVNACDALPHGGRIKVEVRNADLSAAMSNEIDVLEPGRYVLLTVTDNGSGMDETTRRRLFEPFFTTKPVGKGTGLGLSTVFGIVKQSAGGLRVKSELGQGATFGVYLPRWEGEVEEVKASREETTPTAGVETILLVEDDQMFRELLEEILDRQGYNVLVAEDSAQALDRCGRYADPVHLLVSDIVMPGSITGVDLAQHLAQPHPEMKVILMSGYTGDELAQRDLAQDDTGRADRRFLQKPFSTRDFLSTVRELLDH